MAATLEQLNKTLADLDSQEKAIIADAEENHGSAFTDEHSEQLAGIDDKRAEAQAAIEKREAFDARQRDLENRQALRPSGAGRRSTSSAGGSPRVDVTKANFEEDPKRGFKDHREFLGEVIKAGVAGQTSDHRLRSLVSPSKQATAGSDEQGTYSDPYGGYFVPVGFSPMNLALGFEGDPIGPYVTNVPMDTPTLNFNARVDKDHSSSVSGGLVVYRRKETQTVTATRMQHEQLKLDANGLFGVSYATEELLQRSMVSFTALLQAGFNDEFAAKLVYERLRGTGVGEFEGILNADCLISITAETGQGAATIEKGNIDKAIERVWRYGTARWLANHSIIPQLLSLTQEIGTAGERVPYFQMNADGNGGTLVGRPIDFSEYCSALGTVGDLICANWSEYLEGTLSAMNSAESMHVRFEEHERVFKFWLENDARVWWRSALTPYAGNTRSPFVAIATRS